MSNKKEEDKYKKVLDKILEKQINIEKETTEILEDEKKILYKILNEEKFIEKEERLIKKEEELIKTVEQKIEAKEEEIEKLIKSKIVSRKYKDIMDWKKNLWDNCDNKKLIDHSDKTEFFCEKLNKNCNFSTCPKNLF